MQKYAEELERLIIDELLPAYLAYARITGNKDAYKNIHPKLVYAMKQKRKLPRLLEKVDNGRS